MEEKKIEEIVNVGGEEEGRNLITVKEVEALREAIKPVYLLYQSTSEFEEFTNTHLASTKGDLTEDINLQKEVLSITKNIEKKISPTMSVIDKIDEIMEKHGGDMYDEWWTVHTDSVVGYAWLLTTKEILERSNGNYTPLKLRKELTGYFSFQDNLKLSKEAYKRAERDDEFAKKVELYDTIMDTFWMNLVQTAEDNSDIKSSFGDVVSFVEEINKMKN